MKVLILGATSALAHEAARCFAKDGAELFLVARTESKLAVVANDLKARGARRVETGLFDLNELDRHEALLNEAIAALGGLDMLLIAHGTLGDQRKCELSVAETLQELNTNFISVVSLLTISANYFEQQRHGCIAVISSVAGERGRQSNYVYGTGKAAVSAFLQGLRNRLAKANVAVVTIKPGTVDTPMTAGMKKGLLFARPDAVGQGIYQAMLKGKDIVYLPGYWRPIMLIIKSIPESIFKKLSL
ncbi:short-chain dehydrogenase [Tengunoibacter tsumagoiensis]|uniref:Short-chain dehydrogenase n=2 Tax=Tengunoibacter tsumagoiensis TaxID=2014871 RepID=A0A401ZX60_9CHLR|nr:SDR family oxidoreductase [Tengunoibacter tsumagoiensis]GCE11430.1 short-chain dehydrogenase [Tengunoibacter tsumagoiensis]